MKKFLLLTFAIFAFCAASAQVTTSGMNGVVTDQNGQPLVGATIIAVHTPSGTQYGAVSNKDGRYNLQGMRTGGPYTVTFSFVGCQSVEFPGIELQLGETLTRDAYLKDNQQLEAVVVVADGSNSPMNINRAGASTSISEKQIALMPSVSRSMNDIMRLTPQASTTTSGLAIGGGNYRQSYVTVDGAAFNNAFGIGGNLPAGGTPISLDALEQVSVAVTPFDVRQSGFTGGAINAVTKSGTNELKVSAYNYYKSDALQGDKYADEGKLTLNEMKNDVFGFNIGAPIVKDKLFAFVNFEYEWNTTPGGTRLARENETDEWGGGTQYNRPTVEKMEEIRNFLINELGYNPGRYQNYSIKTPGWKLMARVDWNINKNHSMNVRFSTTKSQYSSSPSSSISPLGSATYNRNTYGRTSNYAMYFENSIYYQEQNFTSVAAELNSRFLDGALNNTLRYTYSHQYEPRSYNGDLFPTVDILEANNDTPAVYASFGLDPFTYGNLREVSTHVITDEVGYTTGIHRFTAGLQFEYDDTKNGYMQGGAGMYVYNSWADFKSDVQNGTSLARAFVITHGNNDALNQEYPSFSYQQYSLYAQDEINFSDRFKATLGVRLEIPVYPSIAGNENKEFTTLFAGNGGYKTSDMPKARLGISPRFGFNWDITGERKYILRGGSGVFTGRLPFVWIVSAVSNSNCIQSQTILQPSNIANSAPSSSAPGFHQNINDILTDLYGGAFTQQDLPAPQSTTLLDKNLKMPSTWKTSLALDMKLPRGFNLNIEGIYNKDINSVTVSKLGQVEVKDGIQISGEPAPRKLWASQGINNSSNRSVTPYLITNSDINGYYYSLSAQLSKTWRFGLFASASFTYSESKNVIDGIGDQVTSAYNTNTFCKNGSNTPELGYSSYVSPERILLNIGYRKEYGKHFATSVGLYYEAFRLGYIGSYSYSRYSYTMNNVTNDGGAELLLYVPTKEQLDGMTFKDKTVNKETYTAADQKADFWAFINSDNYLSKHIGEYTKRGGAIMPWQHVVNFKFAQDFFVNVKGKRNTITVGIDINNVANMLNRNWGNYQRYASTSVLNYNASSSTYQFTKPELKKYASTISTWSALFSVRYTFN